MTDDARPDDVGVDWVVFSTNSMVEAVIYMYTKQYTYMHVQQCFFLNRICTQLA